MSEIGQKPFSMIAMDLDGTILEGGKLIRPEVIEALQSLSSQGIHCVTATGRPYTFQIDLIDLYRAEGRGVFFDALIADEREIFLRDEQDRFVPHDPWNDATRDRWAHLHEGAIALLESARVEATGRGWIAEYLLPDQDAYERGLPTLFFERADYAAQICDWVQQRIREQKLPLASNRNVRIVQIYDARVGKGLVLAELARLMHISNHRVLAIGDSTNDYTMLDGRLDFQCATVDNAEDELKQMVLATGGYVASRASGMGVVETIEHLTGTKSGVSGDSSYH